MAKPRVLAPPATTSLYAEVEPVIGHEHRMRRNYLKGRDADRHQHSVSAVSDDMHEGCAVGLIAEPYRQTAVRQVRRTAAGKRQGGRGCKLHQRMKRQASEPRRTLIVPPIDLLPPHPALG
jgi:hypothetical protein